MCFYCLLISFRNDDFSTSLQSPHSITSTLSSSPPQSNEPTVVWGTYLDKLNIDIDQIFTKALHPYFGAFDDVKIDQ